MALPTGYYLSENGIFKFDDSGPYYWDGTNPPVLMTGAAAPVGGATSAKQDDIITALAALSKAEDAAHSDADKGIMSLAVRTDTRAARAGTTGDYIPLTTDAQGGVWIAGTQIEDGASADGDRGFGMLAVRKATPANTSGTDGDYEFLQISAGRLWTTAAIDQATPGTTNRVFSNPVRLIEVTLSLDTSAYASGDVLADTQQIDAAFSLADGRGVLHSLMVIDEDDQGAAFDVYILSGSGSMGTENAAPSISDANARTILCRIPVLTSDYADLGGVKVANLSGLNRVVSAASGTDDLYVAVVNGSGTPTFTASGVKLRLGIIE